MKKYFYYLFFACTIFFSCEKNINFNLKNADNILVVDAQIENGFAPTVVLTKTLNYFSNITPQILANSFVHNAIIKVSNGSLIHTLQEKTVPLPNGYILYYYGIDSSNLSTAFVGEFNKTYSLSINSLGQNYLATTTIPVLAKYPDSLWFTKAPSYVDTSFRILMTKVTDPPGLGNYIRYFTKKNRGQFLPGRVSVYNDEVIDGTTYTSKIDQGVDRNNPPPKEDSNFFKRGDTVTLKLCNIDKATFTFWNTWEYAYLSNGNPFGQPGKVIGNISNGALGAFCGYACWYGTVIAK